MIEPYYDRDGITIYLGDAREIVPELSAVWDLVVTDPPYASLDEHVSHGTTTRLVAGGDTDWFPTLTDAELIDFLDGWARQGAGLAGAMYVFGDPKTALRVFPALGPANILVWDKMRLGMGYSWRRMHELIAYVPSYPGEHKLRSKSYGDILRFPGVAAKTHPTEKPVPLLEVLIENSSDAGDLVFDPFMGTGSTLRAAANLGRRAIGIEVSERYCEIAVERLRQEVLL